MEKEKDNKDSFLRREDSIKTTEEEVIPTIQEEPTDWVSACYDGGLTFADNENVFKKQVL